MSTTPTVGKTAIPRLANTARVIETLEATIDSLRTLCALNAHNVVAANARRDAEAAVALSVDGNHLLALIVNLEAELRSLGRR